MFHVNEPMSFPTLSFGRDGAPMRMAGDDARDFEFGNAASRPDSSLALDARLQAAAIQLTGAMRHTDDDMDPQRTGQDTVLTSSTMGPAPTVKAGLNGCVVGGLSQAALAGAAANAWSSPDTPHDAALDALALAAASQRLLTRGSAAPTAPRPAATPTDTPWQWTLALPLAPRLSIDAEQLGQALEAVLADIDELGGQVADSLIDADRVFWGLAAGGVACYAARRHFQMDTAATSPTPRHERMPGRRRLHDRFPHRYTVAR